MEELDSTVKVYSWVPSVNVGDISHNGALLPVLALRPVSQSSVTGVGTVSVIPGCAGKACSAW